MREIIYRSRRRHEDSDAGDLIYLLTTTKTPTAMTISTTPQATVMVITLSTLSMFSTVDTIITIIKTTSAFRNVGDVTEVSVAGWLGVVDGLADVRKADLNWKLIPIHA